MKALALYSGGLDSTLAIKIIAQQGIEVIAVHFLTPFSKAKKEDIERLTKKVKEALGVELKAIYLGSEFLEIIKNPKFGYGKNLNPCIDCKILMLRHTKKLMQELGASFIITGEVMGQRPKSQHKDTLRVIEKQAGLEGLLLRPLSAKLLFATIAETNGWVKRDQLFGFNGRSRLPQMKLAESLGIKEYANPAGGCLLTISSFCVRVEDLLMYNELTCDNVALLLLGRHFRLSSLSKLVVGKDEKQNALLLGLAKPDDIIFEPKVLPGPTGLGRGIFDQAAKLAASQIIAHYTSSAAKEVEIVLKVFPQQEEILSVGGINVNRLRELMIQVKEEVYENS
ncbi:MAG: 7-cyano-7-deazaguanine synthase [Candidatus Omnitrophota bacterium]|nr:7-cyano-7-deazaguanine synthase [Candidatus Omnitrophota bacterium]